VTRLFLIALADDFLLQRALERVVADLRAEMGDVPVEKLSSGLSPEDLAVEINSPSLFSPERILLVPDIHAWIDAPAARDAPKAGGKVDLRPLLDALTTELSEGLAVVCGAWCGGKPKGELVELIGKMGEFRWIGLPEAPKPWEDAVLSAAQMEVLRDVIRQEAPRARIGSAAERLLCERLGFAPRRLAAEVRKLHAASGGKSISEALVRRLVLPSETSVDLFQDCLLNRDSRALAAFLDLLRRDIPVRDWSGERLGRNAAFPLFNTAASAFLKMLYLREAAKKIGAESELSPKKTSSRGWYQQVFKNKLARGLIEQIKNDPGAPFRKTSKGPSPWTLHLLFRGAGRYPEKVLLQAVIESASVDLELRNSEDSLGALSAWLFRAMTTA